jgi:hypothetical protein
MTGRRSIIGLCLLCAFAFSAFAAQSASAAIAGTTAFTCKKLGPGHNFTKAHCKEGDFSAGKGEYEHVAFKEGTTTTITGGDTATEGEPNTLTTLHVTQLGVKVELKSTNVHGHGHMFNLTNASKEHYIHGEGVIEYTEVSVFPEKLKCVLEGGKVVTNELTATSEGQGMKLKFTPKEGEVFATFTLKGCTEESFNGKYEVKGSLITKPIDGATIETDATEVTNQGTLKVRNLKAGIAGALTIKGTDVEAGDTEDTPLSATTVETP